jgi:hypothetical protein
MTEPQKSAPHKVEPKIRTVGEPPNRWKLVEYAGWEVSIGPDGLIMLPRHVHPREIDEFVGAMLAAAPVAAQVVKDNQKQLKKVDLNNLPSDAAIVSEGPPPPGAVPMVVAESGSAAAGTIGRPKRRDPRAPRTTPPLQPPMQGARNGRTSR